MINENVKKIREKVESACKRSNRNIEEIKIVAVTKDFDSSLAKEAVEAGMFDLGENYVQELQKKRNDINDERIRWHFIGHLQTNKVKYIAGQVELIHSVDSLKLAKEISRFCTKINKTQDILIEVNVSGEDSKYGVKPEEVVKLTEEIIELKNISLQGLMTIGKFSENPEESRPDFKTLRELKISLKEKGIDLKHLSMGMSNNYEIAIEEGATIIRLGTVIFGSRN